MGWAKLDDGWHAHPKLLSAGLIATAIQANAISYCGHYLTDGYLPDGAIPNLLTGLEALFVKNGGGAPDESQKTGGEGGAPATSIDWPAYMVAKRLWDKVSNRPGYSYRVHDYLDYNASRAFQEAERERNKDRGRVGARARWRAWEEQQNQALRASSIASSTGTADDRSRPVPSPKGEGRSTLVDKINPLVQGQPGEVQEGDGEETAAPFRVWTDSDLTFENFYREYPVHTGIEAARRAWKRVTRAGLEVKRAIFSALAEQRHWPKWREGVIPNPARWLAEGRWQDEPPRPAPMGPTALDAQVGLARARRLVTGLAEDMRFKPPAGQASAEGEGRSR